MSSVSKSVPRRTARAMRRRPIGVAGPKSKRSGPKFLPIYPTEIQPLVYNRTVATRSRRDLELAAYHNAGPLRMPLLSAINVWKTYGAAAVEVQALRGVHLDITAGEFVAVMGPSGCGKSTLLQVLGGIDPPSSGQVLLESQDLGQMSDAARSLVRRRRIGFVFQKINLLSTLSAVENVALPLRIDGRSRRAALEQAHAALAHVGLAQRAGHLPHELSGGEQQRVAIGRALIIRPAVIFADEPTGALDGANARRIVELLRACADDGQTIVMVTHDANLARHADRLLLMEDGRIVDGPAPDAIAANFSPAAEERR